MKLRQANTQRHPASQAPQNVGQQRIPVEMEAVHYFGQLASIYLQRDFDRLLSEKLVQVASEDKTVKVFDDLRQRTPGLITQAIHLAKGEFLAQRNRQ